MNNYYNMNKSRENTKCNRFLKPVSQRIITPLLSLSSIQLDNGKIHVGADLLEECKPINKMKRTTHFGGQL